MRLIAFGGDERMRGACMAAQAAGWEAVHIACGQEADAAKEDADVVLLPWPVSVRDGHLTGAAEDFSLQVPRCRVLLHGSGVKEGDYPQAGKMVNPQLDEAFLRRNAQLTAEGAVFAAMKRLGRALLGKTCMITGFGRIGQELTVRLCAMGMFVIVCARNEGQMRRAHQMGAHPVPLAQIAPAAEQAAVIFNTVPAHVLRHEALARIRRETLVLELASPPYGADLALASRMGVDVVVEGGLPGRYAPLDAGAALFEAALRALENAPGEEEAMADG